MSNKELAKNITAKAIVSEYDNGVDFDLIAVIGFRREVLFDDKIKDLKKATAEIEKDILGQLEAGTLVLGENFVNERL